MKSITRTVQALVLAAIVLPLTPALAQHERGFYIGASLGDSEADLSAADMNDMLRTAFRSVGRNLSIQNSSIDTTDSRLYIFAGYRIFPFLSVEGGYVDLGSVRYSANGFITNQGFGNPQVIANVEYDTKGLAANALGNLPLGDHFDLHARAGIFSVDTEVTVTGNSPAGTVSDSSISVGMQFGLGAAVHLGNHFSISADWTHYFDVASGDEDDDDGEDFDANGFDIDALSLSAIVRF
jgi:OOP family OmpA-OmpF porin